MAEDAVDPSLRSGVRRTRFTAVALPSLRVEIARRSLEPATCEAPLAVVIARPGGSVRDEASLLGNTRLDEISAEARALGVRVGQTIAQARARASGLSMRVVHESAASGALAAVAEAALAFGSMTSFESGGLLGDVVWADVTGCAHLFACAADPEGERSLAGRLRERVRAMGHSCRVAIADGPRIAAAVARLSPGRARELVVPPCGNAEAMRALPLSALPLDPRTRRWLARVGIRRVGDMQRLPRRSLGMRLGRDAPRVMQLLDGDDRERLTPFVPPEVLEESLELEYGVTATEALVFVAKRLADRVAARLEGRGVKAGRIELSMRLDGVRREEKRKAEASVLSLALPAPLGKAEEILSVLRARLESYRVEAPVLGVTLRARELVAKAGVPLDLFVAEAKATQALPRLAAELAAELGARVGLLALADTWVPEERARLVPLGLAKTKGAAPRSRLVGAEEPTRLLRSPLPHKARTGLRLLERLEGVEWWRRGLPGAASALHAKSYYAGWSDEARATAWVELDHAVGAPIVRGWID